MRFNFGDTNAKWLEYFERLGYRRYSHGVNDPVFGYHLPIVMLVRDRYYLQTAGSPLKRYVGPDNDDWESRKWFETYAIKYLHLSPVGRTVGSLQKTLGALDLTLEALTRGALGLLVEDVRTELLMRSNFIEVQAGDILTRDAEVDDTIFVCLSGRFDHFDRSGLQLTSFGPGDCLGLDGFLFGGQRQGSIVAQSKGVVLVLPRRQIERLDRQYEAIITNWLTLAGNAATNL